MSKITTLILAGFLCSLSIQAQTTQIADTLELSSVIVTASKIPTTLRETTKPVIIIDQEIIAKSSGKDLAQLLSEQSGILVNGAYSNPGKDKALYIQGASTKYTLFLVDGLAVNDPNGLGGASDLRNFSLDNIERIEVVKGSMSTLYGTDAIAGVVNIITKKPESKNVQVNGTGAYGSFGSYKGAFGISGSQEGGSYSINVSREGSDGISEAEDQNDDGNFDDDGFERTAINVKSSISAISGLDITPYFNYTGFEGDYDSGSFTDGPQTYESTFLNPGIQASYISGAFKLDAGYNYTSSKQVFNGTFGVSEFTGKLQNLDVFGTYSFNENIVTLVGANYQEMKIGGEANAVENPSSDVFSPYITALIKGLNGFNGEVGLRLNNHSEYGNNSTASFSVSFEIIEEIRLLGSLGSGFRAPTVSELFGAFGANPNLEPEESVYFNIGAETYSLENRLKTSINYFNRSIDNVILYLSPDGYINRDNQEDQGIEISTSYIINEKISLNGNYNYLTGELTSKSTSGETTTSNNLLRRPKHSLGLGVTATPVDELTVTIQGNYIGERTDIFFNNVDFSSSEVTLSAHPLVNFYSEYRVLEGDASIFIDLKNILDTEYTEAYGFNTLGFTAKFGARFKF